MPTKPATTTKRRRAHGPVRKGVEADLKVVAKRDRSLAAGALAATARALADELDEPNSATSKSMCSRELRETMARLLELMPADETRDAIDELRERRERNRKRRRAGSAAT